MSKVLSLLILFIMTCPNFSFAKKEEFSLTQYLKLVEAQNLNFKIEKAEVDVAEARSRGARIPPPMIGYMQMKEGNRINQGYEVSQEIPFPTKISKDHEVRKLEMESQKETSRIQTKSILIEARSAYLDFWASFSKLEIQKEKLTWLKEHVKIAQSLSWPDTSAKAHLLEVELDRDLLENEILAIESEVEASRSLLRNFTPELNVNDITPVEPLALSLKIGKNTPHSPVLLKEKELAVSRAKEDLQKKSYLPDFSLRFRSYDRNEMSPQSQEMMVGISLPFVFFWQPKAETTEASAQRLKAEVELQKAKVESETKVLSLVKRIEINQAQLKNLKENVIPRAERRMKLIRNLSKRTMEGLDQHKSVMLALLDLKIKAIDLRLEFEKNFAELLKLSGEGSSAEGAFK